MVTKTSGPTAALDPFIVITAPSGIKPTGESRRFIRRHVMKGKNTKPPKTHMQVMLPTVTWTPGSPESDADHQHIHAATKYRPRHKGLLNVPQLNATVTTMDLATMGFPTQLEPYMVELISRFYIVVEETGSPLGRCTEKGISDNPYDLIYNDLAHLHIVLYMAQSYFDVRRQASRSNKTTQPSSPPHNQQPTPPQPLQYDEKPRQEHSPLALKHMNKAIHHLRLKLEHPNNATSLSAIFVVLALGTCAEAIGDLETAERHMLGLSQIIESRGGVSSLGGHLLVALKCCRFDISLSLKTSRPPLLIPQGPSWKSHLATDSTHKYHHPSTTPLHHICPIPDARLVNIWTDLHALTRTFNIDTQLGRQPDGVLVTEVLVGVMYRLLALDYPADPPPLSPCAPSPPACDGSYPLTPDSIDDKHTQTDAAGRDKTKREKTYWLRQHELFRLMMLSFASTIFFDGHGLETDYPPLMRNLRQEMRAELGNTTNTTNTTHPPPRFELEEGGRDVERAKYRLWLLFTARVSVLDTPEDFTWLCEEQVRLRKLLGSQKTSSWARMKLVLKELLWVDVMNDLLGREFYDDGTAMIVGKVRVGQGVFGV